MADFDPQKHAESLAAAVRESTDRCVGEKTLNVGIEKTGFRSGSNRADI